MSLSPAGRRAKGHAFERIIAQDFQELGWDCMTTRAAKGGNWCASDNGIDLFGTEPFAIQCKRFKDYAPISCIEEVDCWAADHDPRVARSGVYQETNRNYPAIPLLLTKADSKETMAVLPWTELKKLIRDAYGKRP